MDRIIDVNQHLSFNSIYEAINEIVGTNYKGWQQACWPSAKGTEKTNFRIWFPKLAVKRNGKLFPAANDCLNVLSDDWNEMVFDRLNHAPISDEVYYTGYDIIIAKEQSGKYIFRGVFLLDKDKTYSNHYVSKRIGTKIKLVGTPAYRIEILDNCQEGSYAERAKSIDEEIEKLNLQGKEREALIKTRVGQGIFKKVLWHGKCGHEWTAVIKNRVRGAGCPYCSHNIVLPGFNDLASRFPNLAAEWSERNYPLYPNMVTAFKNKKVWWKCSLGHEWYTLISTRAGGSQCPYCSGISFCFPITVRPFITSLTSSKDKEFASIASEE